MNLKYSFFTDSEVLIPFARTLSSGALIIINIFDKLESDAVKVSYTDVDCPTMIFWYLSADFQLSNQIFLLLSTIYLYNYKDKESEVTKRFGCWHNLALNTTRNFLRTLVF